MTDVTTSPERLRSAVALRLTAAIPAPRTAEPGIGSWRVTHGSRVAGPAAVHAVMHRFVDDVAIDAGVELQVAGDPSEAVDIVVELNDVGLNSVPLPSGVRADGSAIEDADERYGLTVTTRGVRAWGA